MKTQLMILRNRLIWARSAAEIAAIASDIKFFVIFFQVQAQQKPFRNLNDARTFLGV
jgi:hypothetical protein